jgi:hypothetical protein
MNVVFKSPKKDTNETFVFKGISNSDWFKHLFYLLLAVLALVASAIYFYYHQFNTAPLEEEMVEAIMESNPFTSVIEPVAESYGVPVDYMKGLAGYIVLNRDMFSGVGLFAVRPVDLGWIQDKVLLETTIYLDDDMQNAQVAAYLLKRFHDSGYSWREAFLIYAFGFPAIHGSQHQDFVDFIGFSD